MITDAPAWGSPSPLPHRSRHLHTPVRYSPDHVACHGEMTHRPSRCYHAYLATGRRALARVDRTTWMVKSPRCQPPSTSVPASHTLVCSADLCRTNVVVRPRMDPRQPGPVSCAAWAANSAWQARCSPPTCRLDEPCLSLTAIAWIDPQRLVRQQTSDRDPPWSCECHPAMGRPPRCAVPRPGQHGLAALRSGMRRTPF